jgi:hypothetical protein
MRKLSILASLLLALTASYAVAAPSSVGDDPVAVADEDKDDGNGEKGNGEEAKKSSKSRSYRDKLDSRGTPRAKPEPKTKDKYKPWKEVTKDAELKEGLFNTYVKDEEVYFAVKEDQLDKPMAMFMSLSKGIGARFVLGGLPLAPTMMFDFHREKDHIQVRLLNTRFRAADDPALKESIDLTFGNSILFSLPIKSENKDDKELLVEVNTVFLSDISDMGFFLQMVLEKPVRMDAKKGFYRKVKVFPKNIEIEAVLTYSPGDRRGLDLPQVPDSRFIEIGVAYSIHELPEEPMKPRRADDRVGYFMTPYKDFSKDTYENFFVHNVNRWRLEKKDPTVRLSEPVEPITFYIDTTIPEEYRSYVAEGIEMWQKAFEAAGFKNAIIAKEVGDDPEFDAEDARYHTIRWIVSDEPSFGAIGPSRTDPRTGEIIDADILIEQNMIASFRKTYRRYAGPEAMADMDPMLRYLENPAENPEFAALMEIQRRTNNGVAMCNMVEGFKMNFDFGQIAMLMDGPTEGGDGMHVPEEYVGEAIKFVTCHEVGHTLGLRHNFKSSISTPFDKLNDRDTIEDIGLTGSIMDYPTANVSRDRANQGYYYSPSVGTWDLWAIKWGYTTYSGDLSPEDEARKLMKIAGEASDKEHAYGTDEDTYPAHAMEPDAMIWDLSDNPLAWAKERMGVCRDILSDGSLVERVVSEDENFVPLRSAVTTLIVQEYVAASRAVRYVGGQRTARPHRGDNSGQQAMMPVPASEQRDAMQFIAQNAFSPDAFAVDPAILNQLQDEKLWSWQNNPFSYGRRFDFPMANWVAAFQNAMIMQLLTPARLARMADAEYKQDDPYRVSEMFRTLTSTIWTDNMVPSGRTAAMQRNLQRIYLHHLVGMTVHPTPGTSWESIALARLQLTRLRGEIDKAHKKPGLSDEVNAHLAESLARIDRALDAKLQASF